jgi:hypothetical protein
MIPEIERTNLVRPGETPAHASPVIAGAEKAVKDNEGRLTGALNIRMKTHRLPVKPGSGSFTIGPDNLDPRYFLIIAAASLANAAGYMPNRSTRPPFRIIRYSIPHVLELRRGVWLFRCDGRGIERNHESAQVVSGD